MRRLSLAAAAAASLAHVWLNTLDLPPPIFRDVFYLFLFTCWPTSENKTRFLKAYLLQSELSSPKDYSFTRNRAEWFQLWGSGLCVCVLFWSSFRWAVIEPMEKVSATIYHILLMHSLNICHIWFCMNTWLFVLNCCSSQDKIYYATQQGDRGDKQHTEGHNWSK